MVSYFFLVGCLVKELDDLLAELVVGFGPDATSLVGLDHSVFVCVEIKINYMTSAFF